MEIIMTTTRVTVPIEPTEAMLRAGHVAILADDRPLYVDDARAVWLAMIDAAKRDKGTDLAFNPDAMISALAAAPAPSSLAGGELIADLTVLASCDDMEVSHNGGDTNIGDVARRCLAALSPEAPAREGVVKACADFQEAIDYFEADVADALAEDSERADLWDREVTVNIDALKTVMSAALTPRHEAPARDGVALDKRIADAAERDRRERDKAFRGESYEPLTPRHEASACKNKGGDVDQLSAGCLVPGCTSETGETCKGPENA